MTYRHPKTAFTLLEIMIVVALIGLLAALAFPLYIKARKQSQGRRIVSDARLLDGAVDQWALEKGKKDGDAIDTWSRDGIVSYTKGKFNMPVSGALEFKDVLKNDYTFGTVGDHQVQVNYNTRTALSGVGIEWGAY